MKFGTDGGRYNFFLRPIRNRIHVGELPREFGGGNGMSSECDLLGQACPLSGGCSWRPNSRAERHHPMQAMQNYAIGIVTARMTRAIIAMGFDPCFGFLHDGRKPGRLSLVWDAIEPLRPKLVKAVFKYAGTHEFERRDFLVLVHKITLERLERTVRLAPELAKEIATVAVKAVSVSECIKTVRWLVKLL